MVLTQQPVKLIIKHIRITNYGVLLVVPTS